MRGDSERLKDILEAIARIERYANRGKRAFELDELIQVWIIYHLQSIGEAARVMSRTLTEQHPDAPWSDAIELRNVLVHRYFRVSLDIVWDIVEQDLPDLKNPVERILQRFEGNRDT